MISIFPPKIGTLEKFFWVSMYIFLIGYSCLGLPGMSGLRGPICAVVILSAVMCFFNHLQTNHFVSGSIGIVALTIWGLTMGSMNGGATTGMVLDTTVCMSMLFSIHLLKYKAEDIIKYLLIACVASVVCFIICFLFNPLAIDDVVGRGSVSSESFIATSMCWPMAIIVTLLMAFKEDKRWYVIFAFVYWGLCVWFNMLYLKRAIFVDSAFLLVAVFWLYKVAFQKNIIKSSINLVIVAILAIVVIYLLAYYLFHFDLTPIIERITQRFDEVDETGTVRIDESQNYLAGATIFDLIFGKGFGVPHHGLGMEKSNTALHIGIYNLILKHGVFLIFFYIKMIVSIVRKAVFYGSIKGYSKLRYASTAAVIAIFPPFLSYCNDWSTSPIYCMMWFSIIYSYYGSVYEKEAYRTI